VTNRVTNPKPKEEPMTMTELTTDLNVLGVTITADLIERMRRGTAEAEAILEQHLPALLRLKALYAEAEALEEAAYLALKVRVDETRALDAVGELVAALTGARSLNIALGNLACAADPDTTFNAAHAGVEFPVGTRALIEMAENGVTTEMEVTHGLGPWLGVDGEHYRLQPVQGDGIYLVDHDELAAGVKKLSEAS
jgi:hypothetical protein